MKVVTILGTRPEIIRLSRIVPALDAACDHVLVHTGQNWDELLSDVFFRDLGIRPPDRFLGIREASFGEQVGRIIAESERVLTEERPDRVVILGDTNSGLAAFVATRLGIPVYHLEAGNRCFDDRVPEEVNRRVIDHCSAVLMPYTERSRANLIREGVAGDRIFVIGNPIFEVLEYYRDRIDTSSALADLGLERRGYLLTTLHRQENVDNPERLRSLVRAMDTLAEEFAAPVVVSVHPRTAGRLTEQGVAPTDPRVRLLSPFGLFDFVALERGARIVLSDSGTVQEECCILGVPAVTLRDVTERPETIECGSNVLAGADPVDIVRAARTADGSVGWTPPREYLVDRVSATVTRIVTGFHSGRRNAS